MGFTSFPHDRYLDKFTVLTNRLSTTIYYTEITKKTRWCRQTPKHEKKTITHGHCFSDKKKTAGPKVTAVRSVLSCRNKLLKPSSGSSLAAFGQTVTDAMFLHNCCFCVHTKTNVSVHPFVDERVRNTPSTMGNFQTSLMSILPGVIPERPISTGHCHE